MGKRDYDPEMLILGYESAKKSGLARACFSGRILSLFAIKDKAKIANYILGAVLQGDIFAAKNSGALSAEKDTRVIVAGKEPLRNAIAELLRYDGSFGDIVEHTEEGELSLSTIGACIIAEKLEI